MGGWEDLPTCSHAMRRTPKANGARLEKERRLGAPRRKEPTEDNCTPTTTIVTGLQHLGCRRGSNHGRLKCQRPSIKTKRPGHSCLTPIRALSNQGNTWVGGKTIHPDLFARLCGEPRKRTMRNNRKERRLGASIYCTPTTTIVTGLQHWGCRRGSNHGRLKCQRPSI